jgi:hypothetical protein
MKKWQVLRTCHRMKQRLRISHALDVYDIPGEEVVVRRSAGARPALQILVRWMKPLGRSEKT